MQILNVLPVSFFQWCEQMPVGHYIREATWIFAIIETIHIMALAVLLGTRVVVALRLMGIAMMKHSARELSDFLDPWFWTSFAVMIITGACLFASEAVRLSQSGPFAFKMMLLLSAMAVHLTLHRKATADEVQSAILSKMAAGLSLFCWFGIALAGRAIAFL